ncbi:hypothetical protein D3C78_845520 [compost metagenome]
MAFRKTIAAEPFELLEDTFGKFLLITTLHHARDELFPEFGNGTHILEGRHGSAQLVRLICGKTGAIHGDPHGLLLKQRNTHRLFQNIFQFRFFITNRLLSLSATQIGMHHIPLNGAGANNGDLNDEVIKLLRPQARQHRHLRPALDLECAERIGLLDHGIGGTIIRRHGGEIIFLSSARLQQIEAALHAGEHAERQAIHFHEFHDIDIVLVPFDDLAIIHGGGFDRHQFVQPVMGQHKAARMLAMMARCADKLVGQFEGKLQATILHIEVQFLHLLFTHPLAPAPDLRG